MSEKLPEARLRSKLEKYMRKTSKLMWVLRVVTVSILVIFLVLLFHGRLNEALLALFVLLINFVIVVRHDLVGLMLKLLPEADPDRG